MERTRGWRRGGEGRRGAQERTAKETYSDFDGLHEVVVVGVEVGRVLPEILEEENVAGNSLNGVDEEGLEAVAVGAEL